MDKEELKKQAQKYLELNEPIFVTKLAPKLKNHARLIYIIGLVLLAIALLSSFIMIFTAPQAVPFSLLFIIVEFFILRMFCEFLVTYDK